MKSEDVVIGMKVFITGVDKYICKAGNMDGFIDDGKAYIVERMTAHGTFQLSNTWYYLPESFTPVGDVVIGKKAVKIKKKKAPKQPKIFKSLRHKLHNNILKGSKSGICSFLMASKDKVMEYKNMPCHAALGYVDLLGEEVTSLIYGLSFDVKKVSAENITAYQMYVEYILNESPWKDCFITKKYSTGIKMEILMNVNHSENKIAAACMALRSGHEHQQNLLQMFKELCDKGYSKHTAMLFGFGFRRNTVDRIVECGFGGGHMPLNRNMSIEDLVKFFTTGYHLDDQKKLFKDFRGEYRVHSKIAKEGKGSFNAFTSEVLNKKAAFGAVEHVGDEVFYNIVSKFDNLLKEAK